jgi:hypothetical protein
VQLLVSLLTISTGVLGEWEGIMDEEPDEGGIHQWSDISQFPDHLKK